MSVYASVHMRAGDTVSPTLGGSGVLHIQAGNADLFIYPGHWLHGMLCDGLDLQEESAPAENEDGAPLEVA